MCAYAMHQTILYVNISMCVCVCVSLSIAAGKTKPYNADGRRLWVTDGTEDPFTGTCLFFIKQNAQRAITALNIHQVSGRNRAG